MSSSNTCKDLNLTNRRSTTNRECKVSKDDGQRNLPVVLKCTYPVSMLHTSLWPGKLIEKFCNNITELTDLMEDKNSSKKDGKIVIHRPKQPRQKT